jgi:ribonuclease VapC
MKVLDAWALLAWLGGEEPAAGRVNRMLLAAARGRGPLAVSVVNLGEVFYRIARRTGLEAARRIRTALLTAPFEVVPASDEQVWMAAEWKARFAISYADGFAAALAASRDAPLVTGDPDFEPLAASGQLRLERLHRRRG